MLLKKEQLWQRLETNRTDPVYLFYGQEEFLIREAIEKIKMVFFKNETKNIQYQYIYGDEVSIDKLIEFALTQSFGNPLKLMCYKLMGRPKASEKEVISSYLDRPGKYTIIIFTAEDADLNAAFFKCLKEKAVVVRFYPLFESQVPDWIRRKAIQMGVQITAGAARLLSELVGSDLSLLFNELQKMSIYLSNKKTIDVKDVEKTVGKTRIFSVFELTRSLGEKDMEKSLRMIRQLIDAGQSSVGIISLVAKHFSRLFEVKSLIEKGKKQAEIAGYIKVPPFFIREYIQQSNLFDSEDIKMLFRVFLNTDIQLKSSSLSQGLILEALVFEICAPDYEKSVHLPLS